MTDQTFPVHDASGVAYVNRLSRVKQLTHGCHGEQGEGDQIGRYLWLCESLDFGHVNWHTTDDMVPDEAYHGLTRWQIKGVNLDTGAEISIPSASNETGGER